VDRPQQGWALHRDPRTGAFFVRFTIAGRRYHRSTRTRDRAEAQERAALIYSQALSRGTLAPTSTRPFGGLDLEDLFGAWLASMETEKRPATIEIWTGYVQAHWLKFFRSPAELVSERMLARYVEERLRKVTASTVRKECSGLQTFLRWCARPSVGYLHEAPKVPRPDRDAKGRRAKQHMRVDLTREQMEALIAALPEHVRAREEGEPARPCRALFRVLAETGLRIGTLYRLEAPRDYRHGASQLLVRDEADKAGWGRTLPLTEAARAALDSVVPESGPIFEPIDMRAQLEQAAIAIGIEPHVARHLGHHDFRHARATELVDAGASLTGTAYLLGHKRLSTTDGYLHGRHAAAVAALAAADGRRDGRGAPETTTPGGEARRIPSDDSMAIAEERTRTSTGVTHQILSLTTRLQTSSFQRDSASPSASERQETPPDGRRVRLREAAIKFCEAVVARDPHAIDRALDLARAAAELLDEQAHESNASEASS